MHRLLHFHAFILWHLASHLGTLDALCEGCNVGAEPEDGVWWTNPKDGVWWTYPEDGRTKQVPGWEMHAKRVSSNKH
jgi:hypothetical protein